MNKNSLKRGLSLYLDLFRSGRRYPLLRGQNCTPNNSQGEGEYDCGFHSIFFKGMVAYLPLVLPVSDEVILPFLPTPRRFLPLRISDSAWTFRSKFPSAHRTSQRGAPEEFFVR